MMLVFKIFKDSFPRHTAWRNKRVRNVTVNRALLMMNEITFSCHANSKELEFHRKNIRG